MPQRPQDWLPQSTRDLNHARPFTGGGYHEWVCFAAHQAEGKGLKALFQHLRAEAWGHSLTELLAVLPENLKIDSSLADAAKRLDKHYIPSRYPNSFSQGASRLLHFGRGAAGHR